MDVQQTNDGSNGWFAFAPEPRVQRAWNVEGWTSPENTDWFDESSGVLFRPEYGSELPLDPDLWWRLGLSPQLLDDLADWQAAFTHNFDPFDGGFAPGIRAEWSRQGQQLQQRLRDELPDHIELFVDLWPITST